MLQEHKILIAVTGASGSIYANHLLEALVTKVSRIYLVMSETALKVCNHELAQVKDGILIRALSGKLEESEKNVIRYFENTDLFAPIASGTSTPSSMIIVPCSMGTMARIAHGISSNLIERAADVVLKQKRQLIVCPRESPLNLIQIRNMAILCETGAEILPLMPGFYQHPKSIDDLVNFSVGKVLEQSNIDHSLYRPWNSRMR